jgi:hypothetical protein
LVTSSPVALFTNGGPPVCLLAHDHEVAERSGERAVAGGGAEHEAHHRYVAAEVGHRQQIVGCASAAAGVGQPVPGALEHHHEGHALLERQLGDAVALRGAALADRAGQGREVLDTRKARAAVHAAETAHEGVAGHTLDGADQYAELHEGALVEQAQDALARVELAARVHEAFDALGAAQLARPGLLVLQLLQQRLPVGRVVALRQGSVLAAPVPIGAQTTPPGVPQAPLAR